jgi:hypothetical protein
MQQAFAIKFILICNFITVHATNMVLFHRFTDKSVSISLK